METVQDSSEPAAVWAKSVFRRAAEVTIPDAVARISIGLKNLAIQFKTMFAIRWIPLLFPESPLSLQVLAEQVQTTVHPAAQRHPLQRLCPVRNLRLSVFGCAVTTNGSEVPRAVFGTAEETVPALSVVLPVRTELFMRIQRATNTTSPLKFGAKGTVVPELIFFGFSAAIGITTGQETGISILLAGAVIVTLGLEQNWRDFLTKPAFQ